MQKFLLSALLCVGLVGTGSPMQKKNNLNKQGQQETTINLKKKNKKFVDETNAPELQNLEIKDISELLDKAKKAYKFGAYESPTIETKNKGALCKAILSPKILMIVVVIAGCFILLPIIDAMIPTTTVCDPFNISGLSLANETGLINATDLANETGILNETARMGTQCVTVKNQFLSGIMSNFQSYLPFIIVMQIIGTVGMIYSDVNAISPTPAITLDNNVIGVDNHVMDQIRRYMNIFKNPQIFKDLGAKLPKGLLLVGPAGTGKTLIARAIAGETKKAFFDAPATSFIRPLDIENQFNLARKYKPSVLFIDEIDTIGAVNRGLQSSDSTSNSKIALLNQLLVELANQQNNNVMIIAATNYPNILDGALTRSGRFDNIIEIPKPDFNGRIKLLIHYIFKLPKLNAQTITTNLINNIAETTKGFTASDFENIVNQAALVAGSNNKKTVDAADIEAGLGVIFANKKALCQKY